MKKILAGIISSLAVVALCICLTACSTSITGTWKFHKASGTVSGMEINYEVGKEIAGTGVKITEDFIVITINEDNTFEMKSAMMGNESLNGTWEEKDGKYYLSIQGEAVEVTLSGTTLIMEQEGMKVELKK